MVKAKVESLHLVHIQSLREKSRERQMLTLSQLMKLQICNLRRVRSLRLVRSELGSFNDTSSRQAGSQEDEVVCYVDVFFMFEMAMQDEEKEVESRGPSTLAYGSASLM